MSSENPNSPVRFFKLGIWLAWVLLAVAFVVLALPVWLRMTAIPDRMRHPPTELATTQTPVPNLPAPATDPPQTADTSQTPGNPAAPALARAGSPPSSVKAEISALYEGLREKLGRRDHKPLLVALAGYGPQLFSFPRRSAPDPIEPSDALDRYPSIVESLAKLIDLSADFRPSLPIGNPSRPDSKLPSFDDETFLRLLTIASAQTVRCIDENRPEDAVQWLFRYWAFARTAARSEDEASRDDVGFPSFLLTGAAVDDAARLTEAMLSRIELNPNQVRRLQLAVAQFSSSSLSGKSALRARAQETYLAARRAYIERLDGSWRTPAFGWSDESPWPWSSYRYHVAIFGGFDLPRVDRYGLLAARAISNKSHSRTYLLQFDRAWREFIDDLDAPVSRLIADRYGDRTQWPMNYGDALEAYPPRVHFREYFRAQAHLDLVRAALDVAADAESAIRARAAHRRGEDDPWRDCFAEGVLSLDSTTSATVIWSLGPDLKDQRGQIEYDPTNGTVSPGDITFRLPRSQR